MWWITASGALSFDARSTSSSNYFIARQHRQTTQKGRQQHDQGHSHHYFIPAATDADLQVEAIRSSPTPAASEKPLLDLVSAIEADQSTIDQLLKRRVFIRHCLWVEVQHLFRSTSLMSRAFKNLAVDQKAFSGREVGNWTLLGEALDRD